MIHNDELLQRNFLSKEELLENCEIGKTNERDVSQMMSVLLCNMGVKQPLEALRQIIMSNINMNESIKLYDKRDGMIYGLLLLGEKNIEEASPLYDIDSTAAKILSEFNQINGFLFIIDKRLRGTNLDRKMIEMAMPYIRQYDLVWVGVEKNLKTHNYWQHLGLTKIMEIPEASFYMYFFNTDALTKVYKEYIKNTQQ